MTQPPSTPTSTYRLQFSHRFRFVDATRVVPYLARLGVDTLYASPYFRARPGSEHGYDVIDHNAINPEVGTPGEHLAMIEASRRAGIGHLLDFVPNHMGIGSINPWWRDVLTWGPGSEYAEYFDIDWEAPNPESRGRVMLATLGDLYGAVLERGELVLGYDAARGQFVVRYFDKELPLRLRSHAAVLERLLDDPRLADSDLRAPLERLIAEFRERGEDRLKAPYLLAELAELMRLPPFDQALEQMLDALRVDPARPENADRLDAILGEQFYRLAYWRIARDEINYRRFFDVNDLAGLRVENARVLRDTHRLVFHLIEKGLVQGLRIDHVDGLRHPATYCRAVREGVEAFAPRLYLVVEKILARSESLSENWKTDGTTGYEFSAMVSGLFVDASAEERFSRVYRRFSGLERDFASVAAEAKRLVMRTMLGSELNVLVGMLARVAASDRASVDFTFNALRDALAEVVAGFPVYRTYVLDGELSERDVAYIERAVKVAERSAGPQDGQILAFVRDALTLSLLGQGRAYQPEAVIAFVQKFQQYTSPVMAKAVEDTSFYRYVRLLSLNEVGSDPSRFGVSVYDFHRFCVERAARFPTALSATATHDHKRGEDARTRLHALTESPDAWGRALAAFARLNARAKASVDDVPAPSANDEYAIYQTLLATWPCDWLDGVPEAAEAREPYAARIEAYLRKFVREAKLRSSWMNVNEAYEAATIAFARRLLDPERSASFQRAFLDLARPTARLGMLSSLVQVAVKTMAPGVPDCYQGCELWDLSLVDPDNRAPVDFAAREAILDGFEAALREREPRELCLELLEGWRDGRVKFFALWRLLTIRRERRDLLLSGAYAPLRTTGRRASQVLAFARGELVVVAPRLLRRLAGDGVRVAFGEGAVIVPGAAGRYRDLVTGERHETTREQLPLASLFATLPFAVLVPDDGGAP